LILVFLWFDFTLASPGTTTASEEAGCVVVVVDSVVVVLAGVVLVGIEPDVEAGVTVVSLVVVVLVWPV
jgi:hypothetical protein